MFVVRWSGRHTGMTVVSACAMAVALVATREVSAAGDEVQFVGPWKTKFKGGGAAAPGVRITDAANATELRFDPGASSAASGAPVAALKAKRKVRVVDADGGGVLVQISYQSLLEISDGSAAFDVGLYRGKTPVMLLPSPRHAAPSPIASLSFDWNYQVFVPPGDYTLVVGALYRRGPAGTYGSSSPSKGPIAVQCRLMP